MKEHKIAIKKLPKFFKQIITVKTVCILTSTFKLHTCMLVDNDYERHTLIRHQCIYTYFEVNEFLVRVQRVLIPEYSFSLVAVIGQIHVNRMSLIIWCCMVRKLVDEFECQKAGLASFAFLWSPEKKILKVTSTDVTKPIN